MIIYNSMQICRKGAKQAGAIGGFFAFGGKDIFAISNNHVLANFNNCSVGDQICQAGSGIVIGTLQYWIKLNALKNYLDIALFKLSPGVSPYWKIPGSAVSPGSIREAMDNEDVYMVRNDGSVKRGKITGLYSSDEIVFTISGKKFPFTGITEIEALHDPPFSIEGESGSLVFSNEHDILGVLIGAIKDGSKSYYVPFVHGEVGIIDIYDLQVWQP